LAGGGAATPFTTRDDTQRTAFTRAIEVDLISDASDKFAAEAAADVVEIHDEYARTVTRRRETVSDTDVLDVPTTSPVDTDITGVFFTGPKVRYDSQTGGQITEMVTEFRFLPGVDVLKSDLIVADSVVYTIAELTPRRPGNILIETVARLERKTL
jgi:hypothetical protein